MEFEKGIPKWEECQKKPLNNQKQGTYIIYKPSQEVFKSEPIEFRYDEICEQMKEYSYFNKGITFVVTNAETKEVRKFCSKNGLLDFAKEVVNKPVHKTPLIIKETENDIDVEIIMQWTGERNERFYLFSNGGENENGGTPITGIKTALTNFFKKRMQSENNELFRTGLIYICSVNLKNPIYDGQTKSKITNPELKGLCQRLTTQMLENFEKNNSVEFNKIIELLTKVNKAEKVAERARQKVLEATKEIETNTKRKVFASDKLKDAEHLGEDSILLLVEGNSAAASMAVARDISKYGILALRGKVINCLANSEEDIFNNEEIKLLLSAMNIIPGKYNPKKLRYGKIAICTDSDSDGMHIGLLIMAALQVLAPDFIKEGRLCWLRSPLWIVKQGKKEEYYFTDAELAGVDIKGELQRNKGLGSLDPEQARTSMFDPKYQRLETLAYSEDAIDLLCELMGKDSQFRTDYIFSNIDFSLLRE